MKMIGKMNTMICQDFIKKEQELCPHCSWKKCFFTLPPGQKAKVIGVIGFSRKSTVVREVVLVDTTSYFAVCKHKTGYNESFLRIDCKLGEIKIKPMF